VLDRFVGRWRSRGRTVDGVDIAGTDVYEWFPGGRFLVHHVDVSMGGTAVRVLEMIGPDDGSGAVPMRAFDNDGGYGEMRLTVRDDGAVVFGDAEARAPVTFGPTGATMAAHWERFADGSWSPWMDMEFTRRD
jgi:hypothetical protein